MFEDSTCNEEKHHLAETRTDENLRPQLGRSFTFPLKLKPAIVLCTVDLKIGLSSTLRVALNRFCTALTILQPKP